MQHSIVLLLLFSVCVQHLEAQTDQPKTSAEEVILGMQRVITAQRSVSYMANLDMKFSNIPDTFHHEEQVMLERIDSDSIFGGRIRFSTSDSTFSAYVPGYCYTCNLRTDSCVRYDMKKKYDWPITGDTRTMIRWLDFLMPQRIKWNFEKETKLAMLPDTLIGSSACWHIRAHYANEGAVTDNIKDLYISKEGYLPLLEIRHLFIEGDLQYSKREIKEVRFDILSDRELDIAQIMPNAVVTDFQSEENKPLLPIGSKAPTLVGDIYGSDTDRDTIPYGGKVTMVDFWYMHCPPCRSSIPVLDSLYLVYKDRGVQFVGVNHWDYKTDRLGQLPAFLEKRPIHYPILLADASLEEAFQVHAHPAFFIVDRMGNVAFTNEGYGPGTATKWAETFDELLK